MQRAPFHSSASQTVSQFAAAAVVASVRFQRGLLSVVTACLVLWGGQGVCRAELPDRPAGFRVENYAITGARVTTSPGRVLEQATVVCRGGRIIAVGQGVPVPPDALLIDGTGLHVYAGFIEAASSKPVDAAQNPPQTPGRRKTDTSRYILAATPLDNRQHLTPAWSVLSGIRADDASIASARKAGFTAIHVVPADRIARGTGTLITTARDALREIVLRETTWAGFRLKAQGGANYPATLMGATAHLRQALLDAKHHALQRTLYAAQLENGAGAAIPQPPRDADLVALNRVLNREQPALFAVSSRDDVERAIQFSEEHQLQLLLWGAEQTDQLAHRLRGTGIPVVLRFDADSRPEADSDAAGGKNASQLPEAVLADRQARWDQRAGTLAALHAAGVEVALSSEGLDDHDELIERLRTAIEKGLPADAALAALTTTPARLLGVEQILGTVKPGRLSHLVVLTGPLEDTRSKVRYVLTGTELLEQNQDAQPVGRSPVEAPRPVTDLSGEWRIRIDRADGDLLAVLRLTMLGTSLGGTFESEQGNGRITAGQATPDGLKLTVEIGAGDRSLQLKFDGAIQGDTVSGQLVPAFGGPVKWSGSRTSQPTPGTSPAPEENAVELSLEPEPIQPAEAPPKTEAKKKSEQSPESRTAAASQATGTKKTAEPQTEPTPAKSKVKAEAEGSSAAAALLLATGEQRPVELEQHRLACRRMTGGNVLIQNGTVLTGTGQTLKNTSLRIAGGKITEIGTDLRPGREEAVIDAAGRFIMPGVIDTHSHIMIEGGVNEATLSVVPEVRVADALRTDDVREFRALAAGVTTARLLHGSANVIGGQHAVVKLKYGASPAEHLVDDAPNGVKFALGENVKYRRDRFPNTRLGVEATLQRAFLEALDYRRRRMRFDHLTQARMKEGVEEEPTGELPLPVRRDLRLDALVEIIEQQSFIHAHCYRADEILMLLRTAAGLGIRVRSLQHVLEGYKIAPEIVAHGASCSTFSDWWAYKVEAYDAIPYNGALMHSADVIVSFNSDDAELARRLNTEAAKAVKYGGLRDEEALKFVTLNPAKQLRIDARVGSLEPGKDADLVLWSAHPLSSFARAEQTWIDGRRYFSAEEDRQLRESNAQERERLIAKALPERIKALKKK
ncbi:MAG: amidohydrolase family protein, partial [Planctomycetaceae bacterium]|nr:amidohydrolase family protein [Planctomycetaceae bacterium]